MRSIPRDDMVSTTVAGHPNNETRNARTYVLLASSTVCVDIRIGCEKIHPEDLYVETKRASRKG